MTEFFFPHARRGAESADLVDYPVIPDVIWLEAAETFNWDKGLWATHQGTTE